MPIKYNEGQYTRRKSNGGGHTLVTHDTIVAVTGDDQTKLIIEANNTRQIQEALGDAILAALSEIGMDCEAYAKKACPVDTGRLRNSITWALDSSEDTVYVGTNVEYAYYVHEGLGTNKKKGPRPYLKNAAANHKQHYQDIMTKHVRGAVE